jgi:hypothetical protein
MELFDVDVSTFCDCPLLGAMCRVGIVDLVVSCGCTLACEPPSSFLFVNISVIFRKRNGINNLYII